MLRDRVVIITGASRGIGRETARRLGVQGARVAAVARSGAALATLAEEIGAAGGRCLPITADIAEPAAIAAAVDAAHKHFGRVDALVNNAAAGHYGPLAETDPQAWDRLLAVNLTAPFFFMREVIPRMRAQGGGHIVNVASQAGLYGLPDLGAYCASKFALVGLSQSAGRELRSAGVFVSYLCPAWVDTAFLDIFPAARTADVTKARPETVAEDIVRLLQLGERPRQARRLLRRLLRRLPGRRDPLPAHAWSSGWEPERST